MYIFCFITQTYWLLTLNYICSLSLLKNLLVSFKKLICCYSYLGTNLLLHKLLPDSISISSCCSNRRVYHFLLHLLQNRFRSKSITTLSTNFLCYNKFKFANTSWITSPTRFKTNNLLISLNFDIYSNKIVSLLNNLIISKNSIHHAFPIII